MKINYTNLKKNSIRIAVLIAVFIVTLVGASHVLNADRDNITMDLKSAEFPVMNMVCNGVVYNEVHGYVNRQYVSEASENISVLSEDRSISFRIDTYGNSIEGISYELRTTSGERLIENGEVTDYKGKGKTVSGKVTFKDLLDKDTIYSLELKVTTVNEKELYFYTDVIWGDELRADEKIAFVQDFHDRLFDKENAADIRKYIETNSSLNDNSSFASVDIHSSLDQITYGDLAPVQLEEPSISLKEISDQMAEITTDYIVFTGKDDDKVYYRLTEYFRIKTGKERMLLIDYQRSMEQLPNEKKLCINDKIVLGIADRGVDYSTSEDGNTVAFISAGRLYSYQSKENKLTRIFAFSGDDEFDPRAIYSAHGIKILDIDESGTIKFAVYGYMNSGRHEGEVGIEVYMFDGKLNTIEEIIYIPYERTPGILSAELDTLLYLNREEHLFLALENKVYCVDLKNRSYKVRNDLGGDDTLVTSSDHRILISRSSYADSTLAESITLTNLKSENDKVISVPDGDSIRSLGFIGEDVIYGIAHISDTRVENSGRLFFPMYRIIICDEEGNIIKNYEYEGIYVVSVDLNENQLTLKRVSIDDNGRVKEEKPDYITAEDMGSSANVTDATAVVDIYKTYVQLQLPKEVNSSSLKVVIPKEVVYEGGRDLEIDIEPSDRYVVYDAYGVADIFNLPTNAIELANVKAGWVEDLRGDIIWKRTPRSSKNQIMAIEARNTAEGETSLAACLDALLTNEGVIRNPQYLLENGDSVLKIMNDNLEGCKTLDLAECELDMLLYYVNIETPVLVMTGDDEALLIVGYNDTNSVIVAFDPSKGTLEKISYTKASELFDEHGNNFVTYIRLK
jgi:hypothetical protein